MAIAAMLERLGATGNIQAAQAAPTVATDEIGRAHV